MGSPRLLLHRLRELADADASRELVQSIFERVRSSGDQSGALLPNATADDFEALAAAFAGTEGEAARIIEQLRASAEAYRALGERRYYDNNATRVALIKRNFLAHLRRAGESALSDRRALIEMGSVHAGRRRIPMHVYDMGSFTADLAFAGGGTSFHVLVLAAESVGADFDVAAEDHPVVFDLATLRPLLTQRRDKTTALEQLQDVALRYDVIVLFPRFHPSGAIVPVPGE